MRAVTFAAACFLIASSLSGGQFDSTAIDAAKAGNLEALKSAIKDGMDPDTRDVTGATLLMWACYRGDLEMVEFLVSEGADPLMKGILPLDDEARSFYGGTLAAAAGEGHLEVVKYLVGESGVPPDDSSISLGGKEAPVTPLHKAAATGQLEIASYLLQAGAAMDAWDDEGKTALHLALEGGHPDLAAALIREGAGVSTPTTSRGETPLHNACWSRLPTMVQLLLESGADPRAPTHYHVTPLHACSSKCEPEGARAIVAAA